MPMKNSSTFIYFVKSFFGDIDCTDCYSEDNLKEMESTGFGPSENSIKKILDFAHSYDVVETETTGQIEMNYN
jgi:hypothetical protein